MGLKVGIWGRFYKLERNLAFFVMLNLLLKGSMYN